MLVTLRFQSTGAIPGKGEPVSMVGPSLTIGRGESNDVVLPDPDRMLSKNHCIVEDHNGNVVVVDVSTNGTFLNYGKIPLGSTPTPLNNGDILSLGPYELLVEIKSDVPELDTAAILAGPLEDSPVSHGQADAAPTNEQLLDGPGGDFLDDLLSSRDSPAGPSSVERDELGEDGLLPPLGEEDDPMAPPADAPYTGASSSSHSPAQKDHFSAPKVAPSAIIPDDWLSGGDDDGGNAEDPFVAPAPSQPAPPKPAPPPVADDFSEGTEPPASLTSTTPTPDEPRPMSTPQAAAPDNASRAFLQALGAENITIDDQQMAATMTRLGSVLRMMIHGMREILMTRTSIKSEFRIEQTMIQRGGNNPLKFSISPEQAVEAMVRPTDKGYLDATTATEQALNDIKAHEVAMVAGMEVALKDVLKRLAPSELEKKIATDAGLGHMLKSKKARYWEIYEKMYGEISDQAENDFHELFAREFARAYQEQLEKLK